MEPSASLAFHLGGDDHERLGVEVLRSAGDGWLASRVELRVGGFQGKFSCSLDCWAFERFAREVRDLWETLQGTAQFATYEGQLELSLIGDGLGHVRVEAQATDEAGTGNCLTFRLHIDQAALQALMSSLDAIVAAYPPPSGSQTA